jgi:hypothetical protein
VSGTMCQAACVRQHVSGSICRGSMCLSGSLCQAGCVVACRRSRRLRPCGNGQSAAGKAISFALHLNKACVRQPVSGSLCQASNTIAWVMQLVSVFQAHQHLLCRCTSCFLSFWSGGAWPRRKSDACHAWPGVKPHIIRIH